MVARGRNSHPASVLRTHSVLCLSQAILIVHAFVVKHALESVSSSSSAAPLAFASLRACISAPILLGMFYLRRWYATAPTNGKFGSQLNPKFVSTVSIGAVTSTTTTTTTITTSAQLVGAALCGFFGVFLYPLLYILGMQATTPTAACVCEALTPVFSLVLEFLWPIVCRRRRRRQQIGHHQQIYHGNKDKVDDKDRIIPRWSPRRAFAVLLAVAGSITMTLYGAWRDQGNDMTIGSVTGRLAGNLLVTASAFAYALFLTIQRRTIVSLKTSVMYTTAWGNVFGAVLLVLTALVSRALSVSVLSSFRTGFWYSMVWAALVTSVVGYSLEGLANAWSSPTLVAVYNAVQPFGAGILSHRVADGRHATNTVEMACAAMVASGVLLLKTDSSEGDGKGASIKRTSRYTMLV